ncbi:LacI family DNA-binding transcriptional regulator [Tessaracoccus antarcticus]|uniref:LacI family DNA-binding transcriptional regulator n=1 Tax=Tessaracoccus antarcticus TaxID=2479848 RepID=UPI0018F334A9|nr:LacI family DNA-binding transcriptional regulator [Tessaracoccus antarcticus]
MDTNTQRPARAAKRGSVTITDVASVAGVSRATASRALNDSPAVTAETKAKVAAAVLETGFVMNAQGRALAMGRAQSIAVLVAEPFDELFVDPTYSVLLRGISERLSSTPVLPMLLQASTKVEHERAIRHFQHRSVDAVIDITPYVGGVMLEALSKQTLPVVLCGQLPGQPYEGIFSVVFADDVEGAAMAADVMLRRGRRDVITILGPQDNPAATDRLEGYRRIFGEHLDDSRVEFTGWDEASGFDAARRLLKAHPTVDGLLAASDRIAIGAMAALAASGRSIPHDVSVIGFDDHALATRAVPPLTTIRQPLLEQGRTAAELALGMIDGEPPRTIVLPTELVQRESL